jgi:hypothetical protein
MRIVKLFIFDMNANGRGVTAPYDSTSGVSDRAQIVLLSILGLIILRVGMVGIKK